jgi:hypothetical protein
VNIDVYKSSLNGWLAQTSHWLSAAFYKNRETADADKHVLPPQVIYLTPLCLHTFAPFTSTVSGPFYFIPTLTKQNCGIKTTGAKTDCTQNQN